MKVRFQFEAHPRGNVDGYVFGQKVRDGHPRRHGHMYLPMPVPVTAEEVEFEVKPHDPTVEVDADLEDPKTQATLKEHLLELRDGKSVPTDSGSGPEA